VTKGIDELLHEDSVKRAIDELCQDIKDFEQIEFVHLLWSKKDENSKGRYYGTLDSLIANLARAEFLLIVHESEANGE
jgi:hypothetical protein